MGWGAGSCHSAGWQQEVASPEGSGCRGMALPVPAGLPRQRGTCPGPFPTRSQGAGWAKLGVSHTAPALLPAQQHPWCCWEEGMGFVGIKLSPQSKTESCRRAPGAGTEQEEPSQGSPKCYPCTGTGLSSCPQPRNAMWGCSSTQCHTRLGTRRGPGCDSCGAGRHSALHLPETPLEWLQLLSQPSPMPLLSLSSGSSCPRRGPKPG